MLDLLCQLEAPKGFYQIRKLGSLVQLYVLALNINNMKESALEKILLVSHSIIRQVSEGIHNYGDICMTLESHGRTRNAMPWGVDSLALASIGPLLE